MNKITVPDFTSPEYGTLFTQEVCEWAAQRKNYAEGEEMVLLHHELSLLPDTMPLQEQEVKKCASTPQLEEMLVPLVFEYAQLTDKITAPRFQNPENEALFLLGGELGLFHRTTSFSDWQTHAAAQSAPPVAIVCIHKLRCAVLEGQSVPPAELKRCADSLPTVSKANQYFQNATAEILQGTFPSQVPQHPKKSVEKRFSDPMHGSAWELAQAAKTSFAGSQPGDFLYEFFNNNLPGMTLELLRMLGESALIPTLFLLVQIESVAASWRWIDAIASARQKGIPIPIELLRKELQNRNTPASELKLRILELLWNFSSKAEASLQQNPDLNASLALAVYAFLQGKRVPEALLSPTLAKNCPLTRLLAFRTGKLGVLLAENEYQTLAEQSFLFRTDFQFLTQKRFHPSGFDFGQKMSEALLRGDEAVLPYVENEIQNGRGTPDWFQKCEWALIRKTNLNFVQNLRQRMLNIYGNPDSLFFYKRMAVRGVFQAAYETAISLFESTPHLAYTPGASYIQKYHSLTYALHILPPGASKQEEDLRFRLILVKIILFGCYGLSAGLILLLPLMILCS